MRTPGPFDRRRWRSPGAVLGAAWLVATVLAAVIAWWAVAVVAGERPADAAGVLSQDEVSARLADARTSAPRTATTATPAPAPADSSDPSGPSGPSTTDGTDGTGDAGGTGGTTATPAPASTADPGTSSPAVGPAAPPTTSEVARTWDATGGRVAAVCTGAQIALLYATPADGWTVEVEHAGPDELEVNLRQGDSETELRAECVGGTPEVTRRDVGGGGDDSGGGDDRVSNDSGSNDSGSDD